jgi:integrase/recombinase XerD
MKEAILEMQILSPEDIAKWIRYKPVLSLDLTVRMLVLVLLDVGLRIDEALSLKKDNINWGDQLVTVVGKGRKQRTVPFSAGLRREWYKYVNHDSNSDYVFPSAAGTRIEYRNAVRKYRSISRSLGIQAHKGFHELRHTFGTGFIQAGGDVFALQRIMGHASLATTMRYIHLSTTDLSSKHRQHAKLLSMGSH